MDKVIILNLNGRAYNLAESGYTALRAYLDRAEVQLKGNPDREEILADLEQAIAEKCQGFLNAHKTVVTGSELERILEDMGPVRDVGAGGEEGQENAVSDEKPATKAGGRKRLYQIHEGAMFSGVCNGLATYLNIEVTFVRLAFILGALVTSAWVPWTLAYVVMMFLIPYAETPEDRAAAHGVRFSAQALIDQGKLNYKKLKDSGFWRHRWDSQRRYFEEGWRRSRANFQDGGKAWHHAARASRIFANILRPFLILTIVGCSLAFAFALASIIRRGSVLGWTLPPGVPLWVEVLVLVFVFQMVLMIVANALRNPFDHPQDHPMQWAAHSLSRAAAWAFNIFVLWALYTHVPEVRDFVQKVAVGLKAFIESLSHE